MSKITDLKKVENNNTILRSVCENVNVVDDDAISILDEMVNYCKTNIRPKTLSLAANQVGIMKRLVVIFDHDEILKLINPVITMSSGRQVFFEACVSVGDVCDYPGGFVERPAYIEVEALNVNGEQIKISANGVLAVMLQHQIDHLDGIMFTDKMIGELHHFSTPEERVEFRKDNPLNVIEEPKIESNSINKVLKR